MSHMEQQNGLFVQPGVVIALAELVVFASRSGGPGGQHVNKTSSRVTLKWNITTTRSLTEEQRARVLKNLASRLNNDGELVIHVDTMRSQYRNRQLAYERLIEIVCRALFVAKKRRATTISQAAKAHRLATKTRRAAVKLLRRRVSSD